MYKAIGLLLLGGIAFAACPKVENKNTGVCYSTIQAAVTAASEFDTIAVSPGTFTENVTSERYISLVSTNGPAVTRIVGAVAFNHGGVIGGSNRGFSIEGRIHGECSNDAMVVLGNRITGSGPLITLYCEWNFGSGTIEGNVLTGVGEAWVETRYASVLVTKNTLRNTRFTPRCGLGITIAFTGNSVLDVQDARGALDFQLCFEPVILVTGNAFARVAHAINVPQYPSFLAISQNTFTTVGTGVSVYSSYRTPVITFNNFNQTAIALYTSLFILRAPNNFYGCAGGPGAPGCATVSPSVRYVPFLTTP